MPIYNVEAPDGQILKIEGPEGASEEQLLTYAQSVWTPKEEPKKKEGLTADFMRGFKQAVSSGQTGIEALIGNPNEAARRGEKRSEEIDKQYGRPDSRLEKIKKTYQDKGLLSAVGETLSEVPGAIAEQAPNIGASLAGARLGAAGGAALGSVVPVLGTGAGAIGGGILGAFLPSYIQQLGGNIERQAEVQKSKGEPLDIKVGSAAATAVPQAALDVAGTFIPAGKSITGMILGKDVQALLGAGKKEAAEKLAQETFLPSLKQLSLGTAVKGTATGMAAEIPTEVAQQMLERYQAGLSLTDDSALKEYGETAFDVGLLGPLGILGRVADKGAARRQILDAGAKAQATNEPQEVPLQLTYEGTKGVGTFIVHPDGSVSTSQDEELAARYGMPPPKVATPDVGTSREVVSPEDQQAIVSSRMEDLRRTSPAMQKINAIQQAAEQKRAEEQAKLDAKYASQSAFTQAYPQNGLYLPPSAEELAAERARMVEQVSKDFMPVAVLTDKGMQIQQGQLSANGKTISYIGDDGKRKTHSTSAKNIIVNPSERDVFQLEISSLEKQQKQVIDERNKAHTELKSANQKFINFLKNNPISEEVANDIIPGIRKFRKDGKGYRGMTPQESKGFFAKDGTNMDDLASMAADSGLLSEDELNDPNDVGGVNAFMDKVRALYEGDIVPAPSNFNEYSRYNDLNNTVFQIQDEIQKRRDELTKVPEESQLAEEQNTAFQKYIEDNAARVQSDLAEIQDQYGPDPDLLPPDQRAEAEARIAALSEKYKQEFAGSVKAERGINPTDKFFAEGEQLVKDMRRALDRMGLKNVGLKLEDTLTNMINGKPEEVTGLYRSMEKLIEVSLSSSNPIRSLNHEALHAMKDLGMFSEKEWSMLEDKARKEWMDKYNIAEDYSDIPASEQLEEAIAKAFGDYASQPAQVKSIIGRISQFLKSLANALRGRGFTNVEDVFQRAVEGKLTGEGIQREATEPKAERSSMSDMSQAAQDRINQYFGKPAAKTWGDKYKELRPNILKRIIQGAFDEFHAIKDYDERSYMLARMSKSIDGALEGLLFHGQVELRDDALDIKRNTIGLINLYKQLGKDVERYQIWKALNRDSRLPADKRSFPDLHGDISELSKGKIGDESRSTVYNRVLNEEAKINKSVLDVAKAKGLIDDEAYKKFSNDIYYIPFYKYIEENGGDVNAVQAASKLTNQYFSKALKGGEKRIGDLMENMLLNWSHILSASMKNGAAVSTLKAAEKLQGAERVSSTYTGKDVVKVMENGKQAYYAVTDPYLLDSISLISYMGPKSPFLNVAKSFTNMLRYGVTLSPAYKVRNLIRDSIQSAAISPLSMNIFNNVTKGLQLSNHGNPTFMSALAGGGVFELGVAHEGDQAALIKRLVEMGVDQTHIWDTSDKVKNGLKSMLEKYNEIGNKFENANRLALYDKLIKEGKDHLYASYMARDLMDFSMQGSWRALKIVSQTVPFFNARIQGLYKLGRDGISPTSRVIYNTFTGKPIEASDKVKATQFSVITSAVMLASMLLYSAYKDDEDFKRREDWDRDNFWWAKFGDTIIRVPKPFEIGAFGTIAERTLEQVSDENVEGKVFAKRLHAILMDNLSMNPMPQMVKPMIDLYANKDSFTGAPIETAGMERLSKQERQTNNTSALAKALGGVSEAGAKVLSFNPDAEGFSPVQIDYAIKSYFGWLGSFVAYTSDQAVKPWSEVDKPGKTLADAIGFTGFAKDAPETQSKYMTEFYESNVRINQAYADMKRYAENGEMDKLSKILEEKGDLIGLQKAYSKTADQLAEYRKYINMITNMKGMSREDKENEIKRARIMMSDLAKTMEDIRKQMKR